MSIFTLSNISYAYGNKAKEVLSDLNYKFEEGKIYAIVGKSGAGKTTLLSLLSGLTKPTKGTIQFDETNITRINSYKYRSQFVGVIFQSYNLLPHLTAAENVVLSIDVSGKKIENKKMKALELLESVGIDEVTANRRILKLSGGEQQRVAIARTLSYDPKVILADEPTGNVDGETEKNIMEIFRKLVVVEQKCVIIVTHSPEVARMSDVVYELKKSESLINV
ncbi:ABC transporter ATP-binding protein [Candidatus Contubernalis alkaliaceticus]|uniref:ABC transporter ATP-binding protein n=1 Tax=Candidatus Contubernalis alkaliaceticus TaxID=338645 RepID=UPI001F4C194D|nr:ABC transporter ATP-binding protein [Candidatus Contubernalis alkalaceticus]UNC91043.1 ABC transporter ATP-binding protein [Candidatus Contubernalis alkalaceticus]